MKKILILLILVSILPNCSKEVNSNQVVFDSVLNKVVLKNSGNKPFSGKVLHHNEKGLLEYELTFKDGKNITKNLKLGLQSLCDKNKESYKYYWDIEIDTLGVFVSDFFIPFSGIFVYDTKTDTLFKDADYAISIESSFSDGLKNGITKYFRNGLLDSEIIFKNNKIHGLTKNYGKSGELVSESNYANGKLSGISVFYHINGKIKSKINYDNDVIIDDEILEYYDTGNLKSSTQYKYGKIDGEWTFWKEDGEIIDTGKFENGNGVIKEYFDNNILKKEANYKNNEYNGLVSEYSENGNLLRKENYSDGVLIGEKLIYFENGNLKEKSYYENGKLQGKKLLYFEDGKINEDTEYSNGMKNGWQLIYEPNGKLKYDFFYVNDKFQYKEYKVINPKINKNIKFIKAKLEKYEKDYDRSSKPYSAHVRAYFQFKNLSNKEIVAIKFDFCFKDVFGDVLYENSTKYDLNLSPGIKNSMDTYWYWEDSYLSPYSKLWSPVNSGNVKTEVTVTKIVFSDGSTIE